MIKKALLFGLFVVSLSIVASQAHAAAYLAGDVLGQLDGGQIFSLGSADNGMNGNGFSSPEGVAIDTANHRLFVADNSNNRVLIFNLDSSNTIASGTAAYVLGQISFTQGAANQGGAISSSTIASPWGLTYDQTNSRLFVADQQNHRVLVFDVSTLQNNKPASYVLGQANFVSGLANRGGTLSSSTLNYPDWVTYDSSNSRLFVHDSLNFRVLVFDVTPASMQNGKPASYVIGQTNFVTVNSGITSSTLQAGGTTGGIAFDSTNSRLFVSDQHGRILIFDVATSTMQNGKPASKVLGKTDFTTGGAGATASSTFQDAQGLAYDAAASRLFVTTNENRTLVFYVPIATTTNGQPASYVLGEPDFTTAFSAVSSSGQSSPNGVVYDPVNSHLFVADGGNNRVLSYDASSLSNGAAATKVLGHLDINGGGNFNASSPNNAPNLVGFNNPNGISLDTVHHRVFVADNSNNRVDIFSLDTNNNLPDYIADNVLGEPDLVTNSIDLPPNNKKTGAVVSVAYDSKNDRLFASSQFNRVMVFNTATLSNYMSASYVIGQTNFASSSFGVTSSTLNSNPPALEYDTTHDRLFLSDQNNSRILIFNAAPAQMSNGMPASYVLGAPDFTTVAPGTSSSTLAAPIGLTYDSAHDRLFVADNNNNRVLGFNLASLRNGLPASYVLGQQDFTSGGSGTTSSTMNFPTGVKYDPTSKSLFVADNGNNRVLVFDTSVLRSGMGATGVLGQSDFISSGASTSQTGLSGPYALAYDSPNERLYTVDQYNNRVMIYNFIKLNPAPLADGTSGSSYSQTIGASNNQGTVAMSIDSGSLPPGLSLSADGMLSGTPTVAGTYNFAVIASDTVPSIGYFVDPTNYTIIIADSAPAIESSHGGQTFADLYPGVPYTLSYSGGSANSATTTTTTTVPSPAPISPVSTSTIVIKAFTKNLQLWQTDKQVQELQKFLNWKGYTVSSSGVGSPGRETTFFGALTKKALCRLQVDKGILPRSADPSCGIFGPKTRKLANELIK